MWLFTKHGFYSAVCARQGEGGHGQPVNPDRIMVRARVHSHLEALNPRVTSLWHAICATPFKTRDLTRFMPK